MEYLDDQIGQGSDLRISTSIRESLKTQAYWARFMGIVLLVTYSIFLLFIVFAGSMFLQLFSRGMGEMNGAGGTAMGTFLIIFYGFFLCIGIFLAYVLFDHGRKVLKGLKDNDQFNLEEGMKKMALLFKIGGVLTAIMVGFYALILVISIIGGGIGAMMH